MGDGNQGTSGAAPPPTPGINPFARFGNWINERNREYVKGLQGGFGAGEVIKDLHVPPEAQNYTDLANQQAQQGATAVNNQTLQNRPNQTNAFGVSTQWTTGPDGRPVQTQSFGGPMGGLFGNLQQQAAGSMGQPLNFGQFGGMPQTLNPSSLPGQDPRTSMPDPMQARQQAYDAAFGQAASRLDPMWAQREEGMRTQLINQGLQPGTEAYDKQMATLSQQRNDAYQGAMNNAQMQATDAGNALFRQGLDLNSQHLGAQNQFFGQQLGAQGQAFGQGMDARQQGINEMLMGRQQPMQDLLSMGGMMGMPGFNSAGLAPTPDLLGAGMAQDMGTLNRWNQRNENIGGTVGGFADILGKILGFGFGGK